MDGCTSCCMQGTKLICVTLQTYNSKLANLVYHARHAPGLRAHQISYSTANPNIKKILVTMVLVEPTIQTIWKGSCKHTKRVA